MWLINNWWKLLAIVLLGYTIIFGLLVEIPDLPIIHETIRNLFFHVAINMAMMLLMLISFIYAILYLSKERKTLDYWSSQFANVGLLFGILGLITGSLWAKYTWGAWWVSDPQLNGVAITLLIYIAYFILRNSITEQAKRSRISAVYNIFAFVLLIVFIGLVPKFTDSLHPGKGGNPAFNKYDLDNTLRTVFYPAIIGWSLLGIWLVQLKKRMLCIENKILDS